MSTGSLDTDIDSTPSQSSPWPGLPQLRTVVSGGQTGVDRAALDWAIAAGVAHGGWCPRCRKAEDGRIPARYRLTETESGGYRERTFRNVRDSNATLILNVGALQGGTKLTTSICRDLRKPLLLIQLDDELQWREVDGTRRWIADRGASCLNVAGPRRSQRPGIYERALAYLSLLARG